MEEAGGKVTNYKGQPFSTFEKDLVASNDLIHAEMIGVIEGISLIVTSSRHHPGDGKTRKESE